MHGSTGMHIGACSTQTGLVIIGPPITMGALVIGVPMANGAPITGAAIAVPQGEPLWNRFRQRPMQLEHPLLAARVVASAIRIVNFLMTWFSAASALLAKA